MAIGDLKDIFPDFIVNPGKTFKTKKDRPGTMRNTAMDLPYG